MDIFPPGKTQPIEDPADRRRERLADRALIGFGLITLCAEILPLVLLLKD